MTEQARTCATCTENDGGLCDLKGILVEDDGKLKKFWEKVTKWKTDAYVAGK